MSTLSLLPRDAREAGRQAGGVSQTLHKETETVRTEEAGPLSRGEDQAGKKAEAEPEVRDLDLRALDDFSHPTASSKMGTSVH